MGKELKDYGIVFKSVMHNNKLSYGARTLYSILCTFRSMETSCCFPGTDTICEAMGTTNRTRINDWLIELEQAKVIIRHTEVMPTRKNKRRTIEITDEANEKHNNGKSL